MYVFPLIKEGGFCIPLYKIKSYTAYTVLPCSVRLFAFHVTRYIYEMFRFYLHMNRKRYLSTRSCCCLPFLFVSSILTVLREIGEYLVNFLEMGTDFIEFGEYFALLSFLVS